MNFNQLAQQLVDAGRILYDWGMVPATSGNFSARIDKNEIAITISGKHKGRMTATDIMRIDSAGLSLDGNKPSAETGLHVQIYQHYPETNAILHAHSINATLLPVRPLNSVTRTIDRGSTSAWGLRPAFQAE